MENNKINVGDKVYLLVSPTNTKSYYRYEQCTITEIKKYNSCYSHEQVKQVDLDNDNLNLFLFGLSYDSFPKKYHTLKKADKIYLISELNILEKDIEKLNQLLEFKKKQKEELKIFVNDLQKDWRYKGIIRL